MLQLPFSLLQLETFILIFIRITAIIFSVPLFGSKDVPVIAKVGLALTIAWVLYPTVSLPPEIATNKFLQLAPGMLAEIIIGVSIGLTARLFFEGVQLGGQLAGFQMGFGIVNVLDPITGASFSIISQVQNLIATLIFLLLNMHHLFFKAIALSFEKIPLLHCSLNNSLLLQIVNLSGNMFIIAIKLSAPIMAVLLFTDLALGILNRAAPTMHIFILSFPLKIAAGLIGLGLTMPMFYIVLKKIFMNYEDYIYMILNCATIV